MPDSGEGRVSTVACTVVARSQLPAARVLARSYLRHHPDHDFVVLVTDGALPLDTRHGYRVVGHDRLDVDADEYLRMATCGTAAELADAVTPLLVKQLIGDYDVVVRLAPQTLVLAPFPEVAQAAANSGIVLAPLVLAPFPTDGNNPGDELGTGGFTSGFIAVGRTAKAFLDFWAERTREDLLKPLRVQLIPNMVVGRGWLDDVPALFQHEVLRDPGLALGYWNLHEREFATGPEDAFTAAGSTAKFFHFDGYDPARPWVLSAHNLDRPRVVLSDRPALRALCDSYGDELRAEGHRDTDEPVPYGFESFPDGSPITAPMRGLFRDTWREAHRADFAQNPFARTVDEVPPHPFGADRGTGFIRWLGTPGSPTQRAAGLSRLVMWLWGRRIDLQSVFPRPYQDPGFREWCRTHGVEEGSLPHWAMPTDAPVVEPPVDEFGVNVAGYLTAELGLGEMGRIIHKVAQQADVPVVSVVEEHSLSLSCRTTALDKPDTVGRPKYPVSILAVNADFTALVLDSHPEVGHQRYRIGLWAWELEEFPESMRQAFGLVDEVWTVSEFCRAAIAPHSPVPVNVIPVPVLDPGGAPRAQRQPGGSTQFLFAFDFNSTGQRKNPWGLVDAFQRAFPDREDVRLVIKATNAHLHTAAAERLRYLIAGDRRIEFLDRYLSVAELDDLYASSDAYVSLHRSEGFGLTVAEAMIRGMPVISTDYSSTTEFLDSSVGWPIPYELVGVGPGWEPYQAEARWADPDLDEAARAMREVADDPAEAHRRGAAAREHLLRTRSGAAAEKWINERLRSAYQDWQSRSGERETATPAGPLDHARAVLHSEADTNAPSRMPFAPVMRRVVRRAIDHYDAHQRTVLETFADGVRDALAAVEKRLERTAGAQTGRINSVEQAAARRLAALEARLDQLERAHDDEARGG